MSDHGFIATHTAVNLRVPFVAAGLIELAEPLQPRAAPAIADWQAQLWPRAAVAASCSMIAAIRGYCGRVAHCSTELRADAPQRHRAGARGAEIEAAGAIPRRRFLIEFAPGYYAGTALHGELVVPASSKGTHGYLPERPEMHASFFVKGRGIAAQKSGVIDMRQIAPTFAGVLGVELKTASQPPLPIGFD